MDAADLIDSFATGYTYAVTRRAKAKSDGRGRMLPGASSSLTIEASVQPASGRDLMRLPEGRRSVETRVVFTATQLLVGAQNAAFESDLIAIEGRTWEVQQVASWNPSPTADPAYWRCIVQATT
jgi:hypothetical protein